MPTMTSAERIYQALITEVPSGAGLGRVGTWPGSLREPAAWTW